MSDTKFVTNEPPRPEPRDPGLSAPVEIRRYSIACQERALWHRLRGEDAEAGRWQQRADFATEDAEQVERSEARQAARRMYFRTPGILT